MGVAHLLNRSLAVYRAQTVPDGSGGEQVVMVHVGTVGARVSQPGADERVAAGQAGADLTHQVYLQPGSAVRRGDELRDTGDGLVLEVLATVIPSKPKYLRADCLARQAEGS